MTVEAYAKVNLTLEVLGLRSDGYHDLRSVVLPTTLADTIEVERADAVSSDSGIPGDLCVKAAEALGVGARIRVVKRIPAGGGLGGGFSCAPNSRISSQPGMGICVPIAPPMVRPVTAISWISFMYRQRSSTLA